MDYFFPIFLFIAIMALLFLGLKTSYDLDKK